jgi:hypothetical protein
MGSDEVRVSALATRIAYALDATLDQTLSGVLQLKQLREVYAVNHCFAHGTWNHASDRCCTAHHCINGLFQLRVARA